MQDEQLLRYSRHIFLPQIDLRGQRKLLDSTVMIIGLGGLGSPAAQYLAASGVGTLVLMDFDRVELSNLQRQPIHSTPDIGKYKTVSAAEYVQAINPDTQLRLLNRAFDSTTPIPGDLDLVLDCSDNFSTRQQINQACWEARVPLVSAAVIRFTGQLCVFDAACGNVCYRCLYNNDTAAASCSESGVLAPLAGAIGCMQAIEAIKYLLSIGESLLDQLMIVEALRWQSRILTIAKDPLCDVCGRGGL